MVGSEKRPAMGYVYAGMYRAKETIKKELVKREEYMVYWMNIIDQRWEQLWHSPLHAAGFYLNPKIFTVSKEICIVILSRSAAGDFRRKMAIRARDTLLPAEWWSTYGGGCPNLTSLAIRILSQTCSSIGYRRNEIPFGKAHSTRNCLERQRISDLVFVRYNLRLKQMVGKNIGQDVIDPISFKNISMTEDWVTGKDMCLDDNGSSDWMELDSNSASTMLLGPSNDDANDLGSGFDDYEIFSKAKDGEEENVEYSFGGTASGVFGPQTGSSQFGGTSTGGFGTQTAIGGQTGSSIFKGTSTGAFGPQTSSRTSTGVFGSQTRSGTSTGAFGSLTRSGTSTGA
ncbi:hypothetical protein TB1_001382 [Malus domestica]